MGGMWILWIVVIVLVVGAVWMFSRGVARGTARRDPHGETPEEILKRRYASGEIDRTEYERRLVDLRR